MNNVFKKPEVGFGVTETYKNDIDIHEHVIYIEQYLWRYPIGVKQVL